VVSFVFWFPPHVLIGVCLFFKIQMGVFGIVRLKHVLLTYSVFRISSRFFVATGSTDRYSFSFSHGYSLQWAQVSTFFSRAHGLMLQSFRQKPEIVSDLHPWQSTSSGLNLISPWSDQCLAICFFHSRSFV
jgi:hypothetical protein